MLEPREIAATEFKSRCLEIMDEVERLGVEVVITKHRRPVVRVSPITPVGTGFYGSMRGSIIYEGDIISPIDVAWEADEPNLT